MILHSLGNIEERDAVIGKLEAVGMDEVPYSPYLVAQALAWMTDNDRAFEWIDKGLAADSRYDVTGWWFRQILYLPMWNNLHEDPRWTQVRERVGMTAERMDALRFSASLSY